MSRTIAKVICQCLVCDPTSEPTEVASILNISVASVEAAGLEVARIRAEARVLHHLIMFGSPSWEPHRMNACDLAILQMAMDEFFVKDIPAAMASSQISFLAELFGNVNFCLGVFNCAINGGSND